MGNFTREEIAEALRPIASLIGKSEKAQRKLAPGTWQHAMLEDNLRALAVASALMNGEAAGFERESLLDALRAINSMICRSEKAREMFPPGTSQHTLLKNRIKALRIASELVEAAGGYPAAPEARSSGAEAPTFPDIR